MPISWSHCALGFFGYGIRVVQSFVSFCFVYPDCTALFTLNNILSLSIGLGFFILFSLVSILPLFIRILFSFSDFIILFLDLYLPFRVSERTGSMDNGFIEWDRRGSGI